MRAELDIQAFSSEVDDDVAALRLQAFHESSQMLENTLQARPRSHTAKATALCTM